MQVFALITEMGHRVSLLAVEAKAEEEMSFLNNPAEPRNLPLCLTLTSPQHFNKPSNKVTFEILKLLEAGGLRASGRSHTLNKEQTDS